MPNWKKVIVSGSDASLNSLNVAAGVTGSLLGTASFASTASYVNPLNQNVLITGSASNSLRVKGSGATSATNTLYLENSSNINTFAVADNGNVTVNTGSLTINQATGTGIGIALKAPTDYYSPKLEFNAIGGTSRIIQGYGGQLFLEGGSALKVSFGIYNAAGTVSNVDIYTYPYGGSQPAYPNNYSMLIKNPDTTGVNLMVRAASGQAGTGSITEWQNSGGTEVVAKITASGSAYFKSDITASSFSGSHIGPLTGTASYATQALTASNANTASYVITAQTASYVLQAVSSSFASTASYVNPLNQNVLITGSATNALRVKGSGATSATNALLIENSTNTSSLVVRNDNYVSLGTPLSQGYIGLSTTKSRVLQIQYDANNVCCFEFWTDTTTSTSYIGGRANLEFWNTANGKYLSYDFTNFVLNTSDTILIVSSSVKGGGTNNGVLNGNNTSTSSGTQIGIYGSSRGSSASNTNVGAWITATGGLNNYGLIVESGSVGIGKTSPNTKLDVNGNTIITGSLNVTAGITGSLSGTASYATTALTSSLTSTYVGFGSTGNTLTGNSNFVVNTTTGYSSAPLVINVGGVPSAGYDIFNHFQMPYQLTAFKSTTSGNPSELQIYNNANALQFGVEGSSAGLRMGGTLAYNMYFGCYYNYGLTFHTNNQAVGAISATGNWFFGGNSTASAKVHIKGSGTTSATSTFIVENSSAAKTIQCKDDQSIGFFGATTVTQPTTAGASSTFTSNPGVALNDADTYDGYTIAQVVKALRQLGLLA